MAKARSEQPGKIKVRIVEIDLEGSDESLQERLKALTTALSRSAVAPKLPRAPRIKHANGDGVQTAAEGEIEVEGEQVQDEDDEGVERAPKKSSRKPKIVAGKVVPG